MTETKIKEILNFSEEGIQKTKVIFSDSKNETEIKKTILFTKASKRIKYLGVNLTKEVPDSYAKTYKTSLKKKLKT